ncbi:MAG: nuclear transport factor 2 family protein [Terriglobia bacterium]|jgi:hypothetical protein|nr:nuclear transport factor 2 family protein [Terriglobia bacterium]
MRQRSEEIWTSSIRISRTISSKSLVTARFNHWPDIEAGFKDVVLKKYELTDCIFKLMTRDAAYLSCKMDLEATSKGQPFPARFRVTYVWTRQNKDWLLGSNRGQ